jgi:hypothetical protein
MSASTSQKRLEIQKSVRQTCTDLAAKLEQLHQQVLQPVEKARSVVTQTVETVKGTVNTAKDALDTVGETISHWPWTSMVSSLAAGMGTGWLTASMTSNPTDSTAIPKMTAAFVPQQEAASQQPSFLKKQINKLTGVSVGAGVALVRDIVKDHMPDWSEAADQLAQDLTTHLGAVPFHGTLLRPSNDSSANEATSHGSFASSLYAQGA